MSEYYEMPPSFPPGELVTERLVIVDREQPMPDLRADEDTPPQTETNRGDTLTTAQLIAVIQELSAKIPTEPEHAKPRKFPKVIRGAGKAAAVLVLGCVAGVGPFNVVGEYLTIGNTPVTVGDYIDRTGDIIGQVGDTTITVLGFAIDTLDGDQS